VVIVNYRTTQLVQECVRSLWRLRPASIDLEVTIVDNFSADGSVERLRGFLRRECGPWRVHVVAYVRNGGFAAGNNVALAALLDAGTRKPDPAFVWLLNPDTVVQGDDIESIMELFARQPRAGIVGNRIRGEDGCVQRSAFRRHTWQSEIESALCMRPVTSLLARYVVAPAPPRDPVKVDWVSGASMFIRFDTLRRVGLLDEGYFLYFEETDYCLAVSGAGYEVWYAPAFDVEHLEGASSGIRAGAAKRRPPYWFASRARFFRKNYSAAYLHAANFAWLLSYPWGQLWLRLRRRRPAAPPRLWWDFIANNYFRAP